MSEILVSFQVREGFHFTKLIATLKDARVETAHFIFTRDGVRMTEKTKTRNSQEIIFDLSLISLNLKYVYKNKDESFIFPIDVKTLCAVLSSCTRQDIISCYIETDKPDAMNIRFISSRATQRENLHTIQCLANDLVLYNLPEYTQKVRYIAAEEFDTVIKNFAKNKGDKLIIISSQEHGIVLKGCKVDGSSSLECLYQPNDEDQMEDFVFSLDLFLPPVLKKMLTVTRKRDNIGITVEKDKPILFSCPVANIGTLNTYIYPLVKI